MGNRLLDFKTLDFDPKPTSGGNESSLSLKAVLNEKWFYSLEINCDEFYSHEDWMYVLTEETL